MATQTQAKPNVFAGMFVRLAGSAAIPAQALNTILAANGYSLEDLVHNANVRMEQEQRDADTLNQQVSEETAQANQEYETAVTAAKAKLLTARQQIEATHAAARQHSAAADEIRKALEFTNHAG